MDILGIATDYRTNTPVIYASVPIDEYLDLIGDDFEAFSIQRRREKHKAYERMKKDVVNGALLPSIALTVRPELVPNIAKIAKSKSAQRSKKLSAALRQPGQANILDGLQRTYILRDLRSEGTQFKAGQSVLVEFWLEENVSHLVYRIIVLNAGQKPMSMRHQIELLFSTIKTKIEQQIPNLELYTERDQTRRRRARKYALDRLALAYQCFLTKTHETQRENVVAQRLLEADILDSDEGELFQQFEQFVAYLKLFVALDDQICRVYEAEIPERKLPTGANWFGSENVMNAFFAAVAQFSTNSDRAQRIVAALSNLVNKLKNSDPGDDPLALEVLQTVCDGFNSRKVNIGFATRRLLTNGFKEYFLDEGSTAFQVCWTRAAD